MILTNDVLYRNFVLKRFILSDVEMFGRNSNFIILVIMT